LNMLRVNPNDDICPVSRGDGGEERAVDTSTPLFNENQSLSGEQKPLGLNRREGNRN